MMIHGRYSHEGQGDFKPLWEVVLKYWVLPLRMSADKNRILWQYSICETTIASIVQDMHIVPNMCNYQYFRKIFHSTWKGHLPTGSSFLTDSPWFLLHVPGPHLPHWHWNPVLMPCILSCWQDPMHWSFPKAIGPAWQQSTNVQNEGI